MDIHNLSLIDTFALIINEEEGTSDFAITKYLIENIDSIEKIKVNDIIDFAHVSRSSIRRYSQRLGYSSFGSLKNSITDIIFPSNIHLRKFKGKPSYKDYLKQELISMVQDMNEAIDYKVIENLSNEIHKFEKVLILSASNTSSNLIKFQQELLYAKKIIELINTNRIQEVSKVCCEKDSLIIVVSVSGVFAKAMLDVVASMEGKKYLLTINRNGKYIKTYDQVIYLSAKDIRFDDDGLVGKYGVTYFFDLLSENYIAKYR